MAHRDGDAGAASAVGTLVTRKEDVRKNNIRLRSSAPKDTAGAEGTLASTAASTSDLLAGLTTQQMDDWTRFTPCRRRDQW